MGTRPNPVASYRLKIERAKRHLGELLAEVDAFNASTPFELIAEKNEIAKQRHFKVRFKSHIPAEWSAIIGDIIHNARCALDLLMVEVVKFCDPGRASYNHVHFVIRESKDEFEKALPGNIKGASADARQIIEDLKPYKGGNEAFYILHQLDITDKHKAIIPVGAAQRSVTIDLSEGLRQAFPDRHGGLAPMFIDLRPSVRCFPLQDGATVFSTPIDDKLHDDIKVTVEIAFGEGQILQGEPIDPTLAQMINFVESVFEFVETALPGFKK
jgi:hypothetical protein